MRTPQFMLNIPLGCGFLKDSPRGRIMLYRDMGTFPTTGNLTSRVTTKDLTKHTNGNHSHLSKQEMK